MSAIHIKSPALTIKAGHSALQRIHRDGLQPQDVGIIPGAAGGPKPLGIQGLDLALFADWFPRAPRQRALIGASIGAWRFASACLPDAAEGLRRLAQLYTAQRFAKGVSMQQVSESCERMLDQLLGEHGNSLLSNPHYRLNILTVKSHGLLSHDHKGSLGLGLAGVIGNNWLGRKRLGKHFQRVIFHDQRQAPPLAELTDFPSRSLPLAPNNLRHALLASGSIPMIMQGVRDIPGAGPGTYRDGGLLDYHLDLPYQGEDIVLYPHFTDKVIPGWFDKSTPWRRGDGQRLRNVVLLAPAPEYLARLPYGKLPDRKDFHRFVGNDSQREQYWRQAISESQRLGDEFLELVEKDRIGQHLQPL
ncbi:patatin-like phospholipase family protein [Pseudomonas sp. 5P_3.1_Bac2]|uniref:patatin-like phospholipase family protein n=1 Tax=Pseudomonas sp. 5P_3.1_Bac2 TaxID=2971617 RepID=UPI0021C5C0B9|nr:patatin-like phospholipase family protein [Pseudomonas sp. 5P_3.1_Bac2]MCU1717017.1 patatin-like phospholipase family protein [Pseudomonas sp. 5P_3.1_Bac2]